jgi:hypothetical protein
MIQTSPLQSSQGAIVRSSQGAIVRSSQGSTLRASTGFSDHPDSLQAGSRAADAARLGLGGAVPQLALVVTAGPRTIDPTSAVREVLGPVQIAGGAASALLTDSGPMMDGTLIVAIALDGDAASGVASASGRDLTEAGRAAARIVMAGWPFRLRYPRGLGIGFAAPVAGSSLLHFLEAWRQFMGPKMRTVCGVLPHAITYGSAKAGAVASVAALEASYTTGLGYAEGFVAGEPVPDADVLIQGTADAVNTALKRLDEGSARLAIVLESASRREALGAAAAAEWARVQFVVGEQAPCVGWVCERVAGYGRGIQPVDEPGSLVVAAIGDPPSARLT